MKKLLFAAVAALSFAGFGEMSEEMYRLTGGMVRKPGTGKGQILVLNAQKRVPSERLDEALNLFNRLMCLPIVVRDGAFDGAASTAKVEALGATFAIFVTEGSGENTLLVAPESRWAVLDIARLVSDNPAQEVLERRVQKETVRAFGWLCGAVNSQSHGMVTGPVGSLKDLDAMTLANYPLDAYQPTLENLKALGVEPYLELTYAGACRRGWAPQPTNDVQRAIWDKVHEIPSKPMKIKFDPNKKKSN